jgi:Holliday junction resolvase RusA-like endonuclease
LKPSGLRRLLRLEKYNNYKIALLAEAKRNRFSIPASGLHVTFYLPTPKSWSKKKREQYHGLLCQSRPDIDNLIKSFCDSLTSEDKFIANIAASKRWVDFDSGWIECVMTDEPMRILIQPPVKE